MERAQCIVLRGNKILMMKMIMRENGRPFWGLPGGKVEGGETPAEAAIRELKEECCVDGEIVREICFVDYPSDESIHIYSGIHSFLMEIGSQEPGLGADPEDSQNRLNLVGFDWLALAEIPERDRTYLWAAGLLGIKEFRNEAFDWGDSISYPVDKEGKE